MQRLRIALYSHDAMGLGHMRRNLLLANALRQFPVRAEVLLIAGARELNAYPLPSGVDCITLPGFSKVWRKRYMPRRLHMDPDALGQLRSRLIRTALEEFEPDMFIVDRHPRGLLNELDDTLDALASARRRPRVILGLRDVMDEPAVVRREWEERGTEEVIRDHFDVIWVYGDPQVYDPVEEYGFASDIAARVRFSGYLDPRGRFMARPAQDAEAPGRLAFDGPVVLCQMGGGQDGGRLAEAFAATPMPRDVVGVLVTGPFMSADVRDRVRRLAAEHSGIHVLDFVSDPERLLERAQRVITMGGYNSVCEVLALDKRALIIPRVEPRAEQLIRAQRLQALGLAEMLHPSELTPAALGRWLEDTPADGYDEVSVRHLVDFNGIDRLPRLVSEALAMAEPGDRLHQPPHPGPAVPHV
jgi:predicted glycosyltransferase